MKVTEGLIATAKRVEATGALPDGDELRVVEFDSIRMALAGTSVDGSELHEVIASTIALGMTAIGRHKADVPSALKGLMLYMFLTGFEVGSHAMD